MALKEKYHEKIAFIVVDVNTEEGIELAREYKIWGVPTIYIFKDDRMVFEKIGFATEAELEEAILKTID